MVEQQVDNVIVAALCSPQDGCCYSIAAFRIDWGAGLDQEVAEGVMVVDGSPLCMTSSA